MDKEYIRKVAQDALHMDDIVVVPCEAGKTQYVFKIVADTSSVYFLKIPKDNNIQILRNEKFCCENLYGIIPCPKHIFEMDNILIQTSINGESIKIMNPPREERKKYYIEVGKILRIMHGVKVKYFGKINREGIGEYSASKQIDKFSMNKIYSQRDEIPWVNVAKYIDKYKQYSLISNASIIHADCDDHNILISQNNISGFIDFGNAFFGPALYDLALLYAYHFYDGYFPSYLEGYGEVNLDAIAYYAVWIILEKLIYYKNELKIASIQRDENALTKYGDLKKLLHDVLNEILDGKRPIGM